MISCLDRKRKMYMARALIRRATPFFSVTVTQQQITKAAESNLVTINDSPYVFLIPKLNFTENVVNI